MKNTIILAILLLSLGACKEKVKPPPPPVDIDPVEAISFSGEELLAINDPPAVRKTKDSLLLIAFNTYLEDSTNIDNIIWYGRRLAYLTRYREAIAVFTKGIEKNPESPELYRHRGHRYISIRQPAKAVKDLKKAAELAHDLPIKIEPDGIPNRLNKPLSSLQFNIWYHLGLAHYLQQDFKEAQIAYETCMKYSTNPDLLCATSDWLYMTYRRRGLTEKPQELLDAITPAMELIENTAYHHRLLMYKGYLRPDEILTSNKKAADRQLDMATQGYGVGNWFLYNGEAEQAVDIFQRILDTSYWPAFGFIAAESDLKYLRSRNPELFD